VTFDQATREAALKAKQAVRDTMKKFADRYVKHEDDLTGVLVGQLDAALTGKIGGLTWESSILTHRRNGEEKRYGADLLIHVKMKTPSHEYSKGVLIQAKALDRGERMSTADHMRMVDQCKDMLMITPAAFVFDYAGRGMRCGAATRIAGGAERELFKECGWTAYRFFLELFRCPVGDPRIKSAAVNELPVRRELHLQASGELSVESRSRS